MAFGRLGQAPRHPVDLPLGLGQGGVLATAEEEQGQRRALGREPRQRAPQQQVERRDAGRADAEEHVEAADHVDRQDRLGREPAGRPADEHGRGGAEREARAQRQATVSAEG
jgi:hypothetical protein